MGVFTMYSFKKSQQTKRALPTKVAANFKICVAELFIVIFCVFFSQIYSLSILFNLPCLLQLHLWQKRHAILKIPNDLKTVIYCQGLHFSSTKFNVLHRFNFQITLFIYNEWN